MWYPETVVVPPSVEPVSLAAAKAQCGVLTAETEFDSFLADLVAGARAHVEEQCNVQFAEKTLDVQADEFLDLARLPTGPVKTVTSLQYVDVAGDVQTVSALDYDVRKDGIEPSIALKPGKSWPTQQPGSRITLRAIFGGDPPLSIKRAILLLVGHWFENREAVITGTIATETPLAVAALLSNHRRGA